MLQGLHGKRLAEHVGLVHSSSLVLKPPSGLNLALTHLKAPSGLDGPSGRIKSEPAHILTVHLNRPGLVKGWGMWTGGRFRPATFWDIGGIDIVVNNAGISISNWSSRICCTTRSSARSARTNTSLSFIAGSSW